MMRHSAFIIAIALLGTACQKAPETAAAEPAATPEAAAAETATDGDQIAAVASAPPPVENEIDWEAARAARSAASVNTATGLVGVESAGATAPVPILLPRAYVKPQGASAAPFISATEDGYYASYPGAKYNAVVNGTKQAFQTGEPPAADRAAFKFVSGDGGAQLSFSRFGADYLIEFECLEVDGSESCITEDEAKTFAESLFVAASQ